MTWMAKNAGRIPGLGKKQEKDGAYQVLIWHVVYSNRAKALELFEEAVTNGAHEVQYAVNFINLVDKMHEKRGGTGLAATVAYSERGEHPVHRDSMADGVEECGPAAEHTHRVTSNVEENRELVMSSQQLPFKAMLKEGPGVIGGPVVHGRVVAVEGVFLMHGVLPAGRPHSCFMMDFQDSITPQEYISSLAEAVVELDLIEFARAYKDNVGKYRSTIRFPGDAGGVSQPTWDLTEVPQCPLSYLGTFLGEIGGGAIRLMFRKVADGTAPDRMKAAVAKIAAHLDQGRATQEKGGWKALGRGRTTQEEGGWKALGRGRTTQEEGGWQGLRQGNATVATQQELLAGMVFAILDTKACEGMGLVGLESEESVVVACQDKKGSNYLKLCEIFTERVVAAVAQIAARYVTVLSPPLFVEYLPEATKFFGYKGFTHEELAYFISNAMSPGENPSLEFVERVRKLVLEIRSGRHGGLQVSIFKHSGGGSVPYKYTGDMAFVPVVAEDAGAAEVLLKDLAGGLVHAHVLQAALALVKGKVANGAAGVITAREIAEYLASPGKPTDQYLLVVRTAVNSAFKTSRVPAKAVALRNLLKVVEAGRGARSTTYGLRGEGEGYEGASCSDTTAPPSTPAAGGAGAGVSDLKGDSDDVIDLTGGSDDVIDLTGGSD
mmetsp:Transcript_37359/g.117559  ORF Transcript_37359/g.117559 Transcript_37359/m.117559 type:complete len:663 (+) Transcript_37359:1291-3279(+)